MEPLKRARSMDLPPRMNLVLCGRRGAEKTSAANAILGQTKDSPGSGPSTECVQRQEEVCGRWVNLVDLPALCETSMDTFMYNAWRCVSLCDPEGVHAFLLAVPLGPLTDEDKTELQSIQDVVGSEVNDFTMVLHTVESDSATPEAEDTDIQTRGNQSFVFNIKNSTQVPWKLLDAVENMRPQEDRPPCFTTEMLFKAQIKLITELKKFKKSSTSDDDNQSSDCLRMVLVGKTGNGKSASGNTILGQKKMFKSIGYQKSVTKWCEKAHGEVDGRPVVVVDTPGLFDTSLSQEEVCQEITKCLSMLAPGPHVFLLVVPIGRLTSEDEESLKLIREAFGKNSKNFTIILFSGGDNLEHDEQSIEDYISKGCDDSFKKLIADCGGRYHVFNNHVQDDPKQVRDLLAKVQKMVKENGGGCYTTEMFQEAEEAIKKQMEKILKDKEDEKKREVEDLNRKHEEEMQAMKTRMENQKEDIEKEIKEKEDSFKKALEEKEKERKKVEEENEKRKVEDEIKRNKWKETIETLERDEKEKMTKQKEAWENERKGWWDKRRQDDEEREMKIKSLQEAFENEMENHEKKRREEDQKRQEEEAGLLGKLSGWVANLEQKFKDEARKEAEEEFNEFKGKHEKELKDTCIIL